jgi:hypothetical protein
MMMILKTSRRFKYVFASNKKSANINGKKVVADDVRSIKYGVMGRLSAVCAI